ncbi:hypothetical protein CSIRO_3797 [Bradyrhizobiaceae bacterium SG-6C]|nr:hypothetical protein CSIRO_3797 [Bradyrhizobiaceae bacterium SG-6C]
MFSGCNGTRARHRFCVSLYTIPRREWTHATVDNVFPNEMTVCAA